MAGHGWANKNKVINHWTVVSDVKVGDVVAGAFPYQDASGHVVIVTDVDLNTGYITGTGTMEIDLPNGGVLDRIGDNGFANNMVNKGGNHKDRTFTPVVVRRYKQ